MSYEKACRICTESETDEPLICPCDCKGSIGYVHRTCMTKWIFISGSDICRICRIKLGKWTKRHSPVFLLYTAIKSFVLLYALYIFLYALFYIMSIYCNSPYFLLTTAIVIQIHMADDVVTDYCAYFRSWDNRLRQKLETRNFHYFNSQVLVKEPQSVKLKKPTNQKFVKLIVSFIIVAILFKFTAVTNFGEKVTSTIEVYLHPELQNSTNSLGNSKIKWYCETTLKHLTYGMASEDLEKVNGNIEDKRMNFGRRFLQNSLYYFNATDLLQKSKDKLTAISNSCIGNLKRFTSESIFLRNITRKEASKICKEDNEELPDPDHKPEIFLEHQSNQNATSQNCTLFHLEKNKSTYVENYLDFTRQDRYRKITRRVDEIGFVEVFFDICRILRSFSLLKSLNVEKWIDCLFKYTIVHLHLQLARHIMVEKRPFMEFAPEPAIRPLFFFSLVTRQKIIFFLHLTLLFCVMTWV